MNHTHRVALKKRLNSPAALAAFGAFAVPEPLGYGGLRGHMVVLVPQAAAPAAWLEVAQQWEAGEFADESADCRAN